MSQYCSPGQEITFCTYSLECQDDGAPVAYIDAEGNSHIQENAHRFYGLMEESGWYALRESFEGSIISVEGDVNLVLCDGARLSARDGVEIGVDRDSSPDDLVPERQKRYADGLWLLC